MSVSILNANVGSCECHSLIGEFPSRGMVILKMTFPQTRLAVTSTISKLSEIPALTTKVGIPINYELVAAWRDEVPFELGSQLTLDSNGFITDYSPELTSKLFNDKFAELNDRASVIRKEGRDANKELPSKIMFSTYVITESFTVKASKNTNLGTLIESITK